MAKTRIKKTTSGKRFSMPPATWLRITADGVPTARMTCPSCGTTGTLAKHQIDDEGRVTPSVDCTECEYHETGVILLGWNG